MYQDIELYALVPDGKTTWRIINEDNIEIVKIYDTDIESICEGICVRSDIEKYSAEEFIERHWEELRDFFSPQINNCTFCENWDKFCSWCDRLVIEYFTTALTNIFNGRLLNLE